MNKYRCRTLSQDLKLRKSFLLAQKSGFALLLMAYAGFVAVLAPLILDNQESLRKRAPQLWRTVHAAPDPARTKLEQILELWFLERFRNINEQEVWDMFQIHNLAPLEETVGYKNIFAKGIAHGKAQGMAQGMNQGMTQGKAELLRRLIIRRFKKLPKWADARIDNADTEQLEAWAEAIFDAQDIKQLLGSATS